LNEVSDIQGIKEDQKLPNINTGHLIYMAHFKLVAEKLKPITIQKI